MSAPEGPPRSCTVGSCRSPRDCGAWPAQCLASFDDEADPTPMSRTFEFWHPTKRLTSTVRGVDHVGFTSGHVVFYGPDNAIVRAERNADVCELRELDGEVDA